MSDKRKTPRYLRASVVLSDVDADLKEWWHTHRRTRSRIFREALREYLARREGGLPQADPPRPTSPRHDAEDVERKTPAPPQPTPSTRSPRPTPPPPAQAPTSFQGDQEQSEEGRSKQYSDSESGEDEGRKDRLRGILNANKDYT